MSTLSAGMSRGEQFVCTGKPNKSLSVISAFCLLSHRLPATIFLEKEHCI